MALISCLHGGKAAAGRGVRLLGGDLQQGGVAARGVQLLLFRGRERGDLRGVRTAFVLTCDWIGDASAVGSCGHVGGR